MSDLTVIIAGMPHTLRPIAPPVLTDESFTLSWSMDEDGFASFHDYIPDVLFNTREQLFSLKGGKLYTHHAGPPGLYYDPVPHSFYIDVVFNQPKEFTVDSVAWYADVTGIGPAIFEKTLTHITVSSAYQCSGRIPVTSLTDSLYGHNARNTSTFWTLNTFRDIVKVRGSAFLDSIFNDYLPLASNISPGSSWFSRKLLQGKSFVVRFEYDNLDGSSIALKEVGVNITQASR